MAGGRVKINQRSWDVVVQRATKASTERAAEVLRTRLGQEVRASGRVQTGAMADTWNITAAPARTGNGYSLIVSSPFKRTVYQNDGTRGSKPIPPKKALKMNIGGMTIFRTKSGPIPAARFMERALGSMTVADWL